LRGLVQVQVVELVEARKATLENVSNLILFTAEILDLRGILDPGNSGLQFKLILTMHYISHWYN
jgi:hypothetical protein